MDTTEKTELKCDICSRATKNLHDQLNQLKGVILHQQRLVENIYMDTTEKTELKCGHTVKFLLEIRTLKEEIKTLKERVEKLTIERDEATAKAKFLTETIGKIDLLLDI
jgi:phage host-nuclease inhibitor protein Gam